MIYIEEIDGIQPEKYPALFENLPHERLVRIEKLYFIKDKVTVALSFNLLKKALKTEYGFDEVPPFDYKKNGKPFFKSYPEIYFNLSHCRKAAVCAVDKVEIGIDVECIRPFDRDLAEYVCNDREFLEILNSSDPALAFTVLWTKKESYSKMRGQGLPEKNELRDILEGVSSEMFSVFIKSEYVVTVCKSSFLDTHYKAL